MGHRESFNQTKTAKWVVPNPGGYHNFKLQTAMNIVVMKYSKKGRLDDYHVTLGIGGV
jgi:hypothetical protein